MYQTPLATSASTNNTIQHQPSAPPLTLDPSPPQTLAPRLDAPADTPGWRDAHGTRSKRPPHQVPRYSSQPPPATVAGTGSSTSVGEGDSATATLKGNIISPGEWSVVEGAVRAAAKALIEAEPVGERISRQYVVTFRPSLERALGEEVAGVHIFFIMLAFVAGKRRR